MRVASLPLPRRTFLAALLVAAAISVELLVVVSPAFRRHPLPVSAAILADLCLVIPVLCGLLLQSRRVALRGALLGAGVAGLLLDLPLRLLVIPLEAALIVSAVRTARRSLQLRTAADATEAIRSGAGSLIGDNLAARALAAEISILWYALFSWGRQPPAGFSSARRAGWSAVAFAFGLCSVAEGLGVHLVLARWNPTAALWVSGLHLYGLLWLTGDARALSLRRTTIEHGVLHLRLGLRAEAEISISIIESIELRPARKDELKLRILGEPNVVLRLRNEVEVRGLMGRKQSARTLAVQLDDPEGFAAALR